MLTFVVCLQRAARNARISTRLRQGEAERTRRNLMFAGALWHDRQADFVAGIRAELRRVTHQDQLRAGLALEHAVNAHEETE